ncbi:MAG: antibiotic biosynthesis monooxygenase [Bacteroidales bacterium]
MIVTLVYVYVKKEHLDDFIRETGKNHIESLKEPGNLRFDILQEAADRCRFTLYEAYVSEKAAAAHKDTPHYKAWRSAVEPWMAGPRKGVKHNIMFPENTELW